MQTLIGETLSLNSRNIGEIKLKTEQRPAMNRTLSPSPCTHLTRSIVELHPFLGHTISGFSLCHSVFYSFYITFFVSDLFFQTKPVAINSFKSEWQGEV